MSPDDRPPEGPARQDERVHIDVHLSSEDLAAALREDARRGLTTTPKELPPKWFYDDEGCELFEKITRLPEYYPTEREREILTAEAAAIATLASPDCLVELGSGTSDKTRTLLAALVSEGTLRTFAPFDVNEATLRDAAEAIVARFPTLRAHGVVGDFDHHLAELPRGGRRLIAFLGGTIGNLGPMDRAAFLERLVATMPPGDRLLLGTDLVKDPARLEAAYDDGAGITARFNLNVLRVLNRELGADFDLDAFEHVAFFDRDQEWIEMRLRSLRHQTVHVAALDLAVSFDQGEEIRTELSCKFTRTRVERELATAGLRLERWMTDPAGDFALSLSVRD